ncbi:MAG: hypothetical protein OXE76_05735 [Alphaproteobacteria bacterium]|nr:hypothetical protein [Alphaproteobacteria bacterium]
MGSTVSGFVMARALEDDGPAALTAEERAELHAGLPMLTGLVDALCEARRRDRGEYGGRDDGGRFGMTEGPSSPPGAGAPVDFCDGRGWSLACDRARRRGLSVSRYLVAVALGAAPTDDVREERALLEAVRRLRRLLPDGEGRVGMRERLAVLFAACGLAGASELTAAPGPGEDMAAARPGKAGRRKPQGEGALF